MIIWSFETVFALASMTNVVNLDAYELHLADNTIFEILGDSQSPNLMTV